MKQKYPILKKIKPAAILLLLLTITFAFAFKEGEDGKKVNKINLLAGDAYRLFINNINIPMNRTGVLADVAVDGLAGGQIDGINFLFSGGFYMSGVTNGTMWANAVASASRTTDYTAGTVASGSGDNRAQMYVLQVTDGDFSESWNEWKDAVALGAYYYDGDANGDYDPVDLNANGKWDPTEDRPDLIGDATVWCVYNDGLNPALRTFSDVDAQGIEIRQTVFAFASKGLTGNMIFVRYSILNTGLKADVLDDVYFGVWADVDLGGEVGYTDDLVGCDTTSNSGYTYNDADDPVFGNDPPAFIIDFFQGPVAFIPGETFVDANGNGEFDGGETVLDTAYNVRGQVRGVEVIPGAKNLGLSSFVHYIQSHPTQGDPNNRFEARNYLVGTNKFGAIVDPCTWEFGNVLGGVNCAEVNPRFMYSGDPVTSTGWINDAPDDQRQMSNTGPFQLIKGQPVDIVAAYVVGRGANALSSLTLTKEYDLTAQLIFDNNFPSPPPPPLLDYDVKTGAGFIDITWPTYEQVTYRATDTVLDIDRTLQGFYITAYRTNSTSGFINGVENSKVIATYDLADSINNLYQIASNGGQNLVIPEAPPENKLDSVLFADPESGRIRLRIPEDPFQSGGALVKSHEYYFKITHYYLNHKAIVRRASGVNDGLSGDYFDPSGNGIAEFETPLITVIYGQDLYNPALTGNLGSMISGSSDGVVKYLVISPEQLTGDQYSLDFFKDENQPIGESYNPYWKLTNNSTGEVLIDSSKIYNFDTTSYAGKLTEGFITKVKPITPEIGLDEISYTPAANEWYTTFRVDSATGVFYVGRDIPQGSVTTVAFNTTARSNVISADRLRTVEIRFSQNGKAYRYLSGFVGTAITRRQIFIYGAGVTSADTGGTKGSVGKLGEGFVDVPFTVWAIEKDGSERQLAVGFIELSADFGGNADGLWDPGTLSSKLGNEIIAIFDADYDPSGNQIQYTGNSNQWADPLRGYTLNDPNATPVQIEIAASQWFNSMYVVSLKKRSESSFFTPGDKLTIPISTYPYTNADKFTFTTKPNGELTIDERKALFDKVNVYPNPLFGYNPATSYSERTGNTVPADEPFITFSNLPEEVTVKIYTLSGILLRTLTTTDKSSPTTPFLRWDLENEDGLRAASGMYLAIVSAPGYGEKILKFAIIMPQKQIKNY